MINKADSKRLIGLFFLWITYQAGLAFMYFYDDLFAFLLLMGAVPLLALVIALRQHSPGLSDYGLSFSAEGRKLFLRGIISGLLFYTLSFLISFAMGAESVHAIPIGGQELLQVLSYIAGTFLPSLAEDIITRGYLYAVFGQQWRKRSFVIVSALFYVVNHTYKMLEPDESLVYLMITGIALAIPLVLTKSLWFSVGLHWACNSVYRITTDVWHSKAIDAGPLSSLEILMIVVLLSIPVNIYILRRSSG